MATQDREIGKLEGTVESLKTGQTRLENSIFGLRQEISLMGTTISGKIESMGKGLDKRVSIIEQKAAVNKTKLAMIGALAAAFMTALLALAKMAMAAVI
jgi:hypothetical protein